MYSHGFLKVAAASPVARVGDPYFNINEMKRMINEIKVNKPSIICFPELGITGYSIGDLVFQKYLYDQSLDAIKLFLKENDFDGIIIFGSFIVINDAIYNCSFIVQGKTILGIVPKNYLPHTNEFYESRWFASGVEISKQIKSVNLFDQEIPFGKLIFKNNDILFGAEICADMWAPISPNERLLANGALIVFNSSASPAHVGKLDSRRVITKTTSLKFNGAYVYVSNNASESTSELVFSGHKIICENGEILNESAEITLNSDVIFADIDINKLHYLRKTNGYFKSAQELARDTNIQIIHFNIQEDEDFVFEKPIDIYPFVPKIDDDLFDIINIQAASIIKRLNYVGIDKVVLGVSGGLDSTLALLSLCYAFDKYNIPRKNILGYTLPSKVTTSRTYQNSLKLMEILGVTCNSINIHKNVLDELSLLGHDGKTKDITYENAQARFRTYTLMNAANMNKALVVGTSDMSEVAMGWSTFNGDHMAMYGINAGLPKTTIKEVTRFYKKIFPEVSLIIEDVLATPITPELTGIDQKTEDVIGKYEINDFILYRFLVDGDDSERIIYLLVKFMNLNHDEAKAYVYNFNKRFYTQQYKRLTSPESVKIMNISLSPRTEIRLNGDIYRVDKKE